MACEKPQSSSYRGGPEMGRVFQSVGERKVLLEGNPLLSPERFIFYIFQVYFSVMV